MNDKDKELLKKLMEQNKTLREERTDIIRHLKVCFLKNCTDSIKSDSLYFLKTLAETETVDKAKS